MTTISHRGAVVDRLLAHWGLADTDVYAANVYATDVVVYLKAPLGQLEWTATQRHDGVTYLHKLISEELEITLIAWVDTEAEVPA